MGVALNLAGQVTAVMGMMGVMSLETPIVAFAVAVQASLVMGFLAWILVAYFTAVRAGDQFAHVIPAFFLPDMIVDLLSLIAIAINYCALKRKRNPPAVVSVDNTTTGDRSQSFSTEV